MTQLFNPFDPRGKHHLASRRDILRHGALIGSSALLAPFLSACGGSDDSVAAHFQTAIREAQDLANAVLGKGGDATSLGIGLANRDGLIWAQSFGFADLATKTPPTPETMYGIGSGSKVFAATVVMQLVDAKLVELDQPVKRYVPEFVMADQRYGSITVRMLINHASGICGTTLRGANTYAPDLALAQETLAELATQRLKADPGYISVYCNDGFTLVETLIKAVTGLDYAEYVKRNIFQPLGMQHSAFALAPFADSSYARAYRGGVAQPQEFPNEHASGGVFTTPADLAAFARVFLLNGTVGDARVLSRQSVEEMGRDQTQGSFNPAPTTGMAYGLGWDTVTDSALASVGVRGWTKNGGIVHYGAQILVAPREGLAVVVMGLNGDGYAPSTIAQRVMLRALVDTGRIDTFPTPLEPTASPEMSPPAGLPAKIAGIYANNDGLVQLRAQADGSLTHRVLRNGSFMTDSEEWTWRRDDWFTRNAAPSVSMRMVEAGGRAYLANRGPIAVGNGTDQILTAQRIEGLAQPLSTAWTRRLGLKWLLTNDRPDDAFFGMGGPIFFSLTSLPELPGLIVAAASLNPTEQVLDPSESDVLAKMMLVIPGNFSRDVNDLVIDARDGEEWVRWGSLLHRPMETVPVLARGASTPVVIGADGYAQWRKVEAAASVVTLSIQSAVAWRLYDKDLAPLGSGDSRGSIALPATAGPGYLMVWGEPGGSVGVTLS